jgi:hypothetical protein
MGIDAEQFRRLDPVQRWKVDVNDDYRWLQGGHKRECLLTALRFSDGAKVSVRRQQITKKPTYRYEQLLKRHIIPSLGAIPVRHVHKGVIKDFLTEKLSQEVKIQNPFLKPTNQREKRLARNSVRNLHAILRAMLRAATDDGLIVVNPAEKLGRQLRLVT